MPVHDSAVVTEGVEVIIDHCERIRGEVGRGVKLVERDGLRRVVDGLCDAVDGELPSGWGEIVVDMARYMAGPDTVVYQCEKAITYCSERGGMTRGGDRLVEEMSYFLTELRRAMQDEQDFDIYLMEPPDLSDAERGELRAAADRMSRMLGGMVPVGWVQGCYRMASATCPSRLDVDGWFEGVVRAMHYCASTRHVPGENGDSVFILEFCGLQPSSQLETAIESVIERVSRWISRWIPRWLGVGETGHGVSRYARLRCEDIRHLKNWRRRGL